MQRQNRIKEHCDKILASKIVHISTMSSSPGRIWLAFSLKSVITFVVERRQLASLQSRRGPSVSKNAAGHVRTQLSQPSNYTCLARKYDSLDACPATCDQASTCRLVSYREAQGWTRLSCMMPAWAATLKGHRTHLQYHL